MARRDELSDAQIDQRSALVGTLEGAGWGPGRLPYNAVFDEGESVAYEAALRYTNVHGVTLVVHLNLADRKIHLAMEDPVEGLIGLVLEIGDDYAALFEALVDVQDAVSPGDRRDPIRRLMKHSPAVYAVIGEDDGALERLHDARDEKRKNA